MPLGSKPMCARCKNTQSSIWKKGVDGEVLCNLCGVKKVNGSNGGGGGEPKSDSESSKNSSKANSVSGLQHISSGPVRKSARLKPTKYKGQYNPKALATKGKSRRVIFKKNPIKAPNPVATVVTQEHIFYDGLYWQTGDIVSVMDDDGGIYYAQIRGFLQDQYCQKSAIITWLLPTLASPKQSFDPSTFILGPEEELPRPMEAFEFVCHAPSEYYKSRAAPFPTLSSTPELAYIWTSLGRPEIRPVPSREEIFGGIKDSGTESGGKTVVAKSAGRGKGRGGRRGSAVKAEKLTQVIPPEIKLEIKEEVV